MAMVLAMPLAVLALSTLGDADRRVQASEEATDAADRLELLLRLGPALSRERDVVGAALGSALVPAGVPDFAVEAMGLDFEADLGAARAAVDGTTDPLDDPALSGSLVDVRRGASNGELTVQEAIAEYTRLADWVATEARAELGRLDEAVARAGGGGELMNAAALADAVASAQVVSDGQVTLWATLAVPFNEPPVADVRALADSVSALASGIDEIDLALGSTSTAVADAWAELVASEEFALLQERFEASVVANMADGAPLEAQETTPEIDPSTLDIAALVATTEEIRETMEAGDAVSERFTVLVDLTLEEVHASARAVHDDAVRARNTAVLTIAGFVVVAIGACWLMIRWLAEPLTRLAEAATAMGNGDLDQRIPEAGPKELRVAAAAINDAAASLKRAERQAEALSAERLDDPVLVEPAPGTLGESLQRSVSQLATSMSQREEFQRRLAHEAAHDGLTKLPNRNAILAHLGAALARTERSSTDLALLFIDLDGFKSINDVHGHPAGDRVLKTVASRLVDAVRRGDLAGRLGGDEFVVVAEPVADLAEALRLAERMMSELSAPIALESTRVTPTVSIGVATAHGSDLTADELLRDADLAVYRAKELGRGRIEVCDEELRGQVAERTSLEHALAEAIVGDEFTLHFQPTVETATGRLASLEALIRWERPGTGLVPPATFIPVAERSELIVEIDRWVLGAAAAQLARWSGHPVLGTIPVAVNISGRHLSTGSLADDVTATLADHGVSPDRLIIEVTETALLDDLTVAARDLSRLRRLGVTVALDDFGTGYMSLATLRQLPFDHIKIDQSFVAELDTATDHTLVELIVQTGHLLGVAVTAEGVETDDQAAILTRLGSDHLQGFLFSEPAAAAALERRIDRLEPVKVDG